MIRKAAVFLLALCSVGTILLWIDSYRAQHPSASPAKAGDFHSSPSIYRMGPWAFPVDGIGMRRYLFYAPRSSLHVCTCNGDVRVRYESKIKSSKEVRGKAHVWWRLEYLQYPDWTGLSGGGWTTVVDAEVEELGMSVESAHVRRPIVEHWWCIREARCPIWMPLLACAAYPTIAFIRGPLRRWRRRKRGLCVHCGYNLTGLTEGRCPECGNSL